MTLSDLEWLRKIFDNTRHRAASLRQQSYLFAAVGQNPLAIFFENWHEPVLLTLTDPRRVGMTRGFCPRVGRSPTSPHFAKWQLHQRVNNYRDRLLTTASAVCWWPDHPDRPHQSPTRPLPDSRLMWHLTSEVRQPLWLDWYNRIKTIW